MGQQRDLRRLRFFQDVHHGQSPGRHRILDTLEKQFSIDTDREYVSGMSLGGAGTWYTITKFPDRFAAAIPVCGGGDPGMAAVLDKVNIWTFHEVDDPTVPVHYTQDLVKAIRAVGGKKLAYTEYPASMGFGHESWKPTALNPAVHKWLFQQTRAASVALQPLRDGMRRGSVAGEKGSGSIPPLFIDGLGRVRSASGSTAVIRSFPILELHIKR